MATQVLLEHVQEARRAQDPEFVELLLEVIRAEPDPDAPPPREGAYTFDMFVTEIRARSFFRQSKDDQAAKRIGKIAALESTDAELPLPERYLSHQLISELYDSEESFDRRSLLELLRRVPLTYGPWKAIKNIFKQAEAKNDTVVYGLLAARFDQAFATGRHQVSQRTLGYLVRRGWRYLREIGQSLPACYAETAVDFLVGYDDRVQLNKSWIFNHILQHESRAYKRTQFFFYISKHRWGQNYLRERAFPELWKRSPLPLFDLLQQAKHRKIKDYAVSALKNDFRSVIREIEPRWVKQLASHDDSTIHQFVVWILENVPRFEQTSFRELDLHDSVLRLLESPNAAVRTYAAAYARIHARDLPIPELIRLANSSDKNVFAVAKDLLSRHDPRKDIGLDAWGELLESSNGHPLAATALQKHFGKSELTPEWFRERLLSGNRLSVQFATTQLEEFHGRKTLGAKYFYEMIDSADPTRDLSAISFCVEEMGKLDLDAVETEWLENLLLNFHTCWNVIAWCDQGLVAANRFPADFLKAIAYKPTFDDCEQVIGSRAKPWADCVSYDEHRASSIFGWLSDIRQFTPDQVGFDWLMQLVQRAEPEYHEFATNLMTKSFLPADFASQDNAEPDSSPTTDEEINVDFEKATFLFTGKLATMTRAEAKAKVAAANGKSSSGVNKSLDYLVIGDEGSPLYGQGRKGSKQTSAESLNEGGAGIRVISETAFMQMLTGTKREFSDDAVESGCEQLWSMLIDNKEHSPLANFAQRYFRHHHPEICLQETDRPVDPGAEIPDSFLTFDRVELLLTDKRLLLRELGLEYCKYEFARWSPPLERLVDLCQTPYPAVRKFVSESLLADESPQSRRWRLDPKNFDAESVYLFCQSRDSETRAIGMKLIERYPRMRDPDKLFMLTESPDRNVRAFVIRSFWSLYRDRGVKVDWKPTTAAGSDVKKKKSAKQSDAEPRFGVGASKRPEELPAGAEPMRFLLRRMLFEIPPGRPPKGTGSEIGALKIKPLPTRRAKILLVETIRDLAIEDLEFAQVVYPVLLEFLQSRGQSERDACLVAVVRIEKAHPQLASENEELPV